jgi:hypothetical protein
MNQPRKDKILFALTLLAALFTLQPILKDFKTRGYAVGAFNVTFEGLYYVVGLLLGIAVYFYAINFITERLSFLTQRIADFSMRSLSSYCHRTFFFGGLSHLVGRSWRFGTVLNFKSQLVCCRAFSDCWRGLVPALYLTTYHVGWARERRSLSSPALAVRRWVTSSGRHGCSRQAITI